MLGGAERAEEAEPLVPLARVHDEELMPLWHSYISNVERWAEKGVHEPKNFHRREERFDPVGACSWRFQHDSVAVEDHDEELIPSRHSIIDPIQFNVERWAEKGVHEPRNFRERVERFDSVDACNGRSHHDSVVAVHDEELMPSWHSIIDPIQFNVERWAEKVVHEQRNFQSPEILGDDLSELEKSTVLANNDDVWKNACNPGVSGLKLSEQMKHLRRQEFKSTKIKACTA